MSTSRFGPTTVLVAGSLILAISFGQRSGFGLFLQPVTNELGWGREVFSIAVAIQNLAWGAFGPFAGAFGDRFGVGKVVAGCGLAYVAGLLVMAFTHNPVSLHLGAGFLIGLALSGTTFATLLNVIGRWFPADKRVAALGIATAAGSFGQVALVPLTQQLISAFEWRNALFAMAAIAFLIVPLAWPVSSRPPETAIAPGTPQSLKEALREALGERGFHLLFWGYFVCGFHLAMMTVHLPALAMDRGLTAQHGMTALALIGLFNVVGAFSSGQLGSRLSKKYLLSAIYFARGVLILGLIYLPLTPLVLYVFAGGMGLLWLSTVPLTNGLVGQIFGMRYAPTLGAIVFFGHQIGSFVGVWLAGYLYDRFHTYDGVLAVSVALGAFAALVNMPVNEKPLAQRRAAAAA